MGLPRRHPRRKAASSQRTRTSVSADRRPSPSVFITHVYDYSLAIYQSPERPLVVGSYIVAPPVRGLEAYFPPVMKVVLDRICDSFNSLTSSSPLLSLSSLLNSAFMNLINSCSDTFPFLSWSMRSTSCLTSSSLKAILSCGGGVPPLATAVPLRVPHVPDASRVATTNPVQMYLCLRSMSDLLGVPRKHLASCDAKCFRERQLG